MKRINLLLRSLLLAGATLGMASAANASGGHADLPYTFKADTGNMASVQRGARNFMNYCSGCHSMQHLRYSRLGADLGIPDDLLAENLMFTSDKPGNPIVSSLPHDKAASWFGAAPPDLSVTSRLRTPTWVYNYLLTFYVDDSRPLGTNNLALPGASMPNVLGALQGQQAYTPAEGEAAHGEHAASPFKRISQGSMDEREFQKFVGDTVNFMTYAAEPGKAARVSTGFKVSVFLLIFSFLAWLLKREYWKDVH